MKRLTLLATLLVPLWTAAGSDCRTWKAGTSTRITLEGGPAQFTALKQAGIDAIEVGLRRIDTPEAMEKERSLAKLTREWAASAGVELWSAHIPFGKGIDMSDPSEEQRTGAVRYVERVLEVYGALKVKKWNIHGSSEITKPIPSADREVRIAAARRSLAELAPKVAAMGAQLSLENLPRACLGNTGAEILRLTEGIPTLGVTLDMNHTLQEKPEEFARKVGSRIVHLHVADFDGVDERHWLPGKGINDFIAIVRALQTAGYQGPFMFECAGTPEEKAAVWKRIQRSVAR